MPLFAVKTYQTSGLVDDRHFADRGLDAFKKILLSLKEAGVDTFTINHVETSIDVLLAQIAARTDYFTSEKANIENFPRIWAKTSRAGASTIVLKSANHQLNEASSYESLLAILQSALSKEKEEEKRSALKTAIQHLTEYQQDAKQEYLAYLRKKTAEELLSRLNNYEWKEELKDQRKRLYEQYENLIERLEVIKKLPIADIKTTADALDYTKEINQLRKDLLKFHERLILQGMPQQVRGEAKKEVHGEAKEEVDDEEEVQDKAKEVTINHDFDDLARQLSVITKRELDFYYDNPRALTTLDKVRIGIKFTASTIGSLTAIAAFVLMFFPPLWPVAGILALVSLVSLVPLANSIWEVGRNIYYGRSPTKMQVAELGITITLLTALIGGAHALVPIGAAIAGKSAAIVEKLAAAATFIQTKFMNGFGSVFNTLGAFFTGSEVKHATQIRTVNAAAKKRAISIDDSIRLHHDSETTAEGKLSVISQKNQLREQLQQHRLNTQLSYIYKNTHNNNLHAEASHSHHIHAWDAGFFAEQASKNIQTQVRKYKELPSTATIKQRKDALTKILEVIAEHPNSKDQNIQNNKILELKAHVENELASLKSMQDKLQHGEDSTPHLVLH